MYRLFCLQENIDRHSIINQFPFLMSAQFTEHELRRKLYARIKPHTQLLRSETAMYLGVGSNSARQLSPSISLRANPERSRMD